MGKQHGRPIEVTIPPGLKIRGMVLSDQVKSLDWRGREIEFVDRLPASAVNEVLAKISALL